VTHWRSSRGLRFRTSDARALLRLGRRGTWRQCNGAATTHREVNGQAVSASSDDGADVVRACAARRAMTSTAQRSWGASGSG